MLDLVHGLPATGKTQLIYWIRELLEEELKWTHGVQFVFLVFQNSAAANINGYTIHHWSGIPIGEHDAVGGTKEGNKLSHEFQCLRLIIIDEISMVSAEIVACFKCRHKSLREFVLPTKDATTAQNDLLEASTSSCLVTFGNFNLVEACDL